MQADPSRESTVVAGTSGGSWGLAGWVAVVAVVYGVAAIATAHVSPGFVDISMAIAANLVQHGQASIGFQPTTGDTVTRGGQTYHVMSLGPVLPYLLFAPFDGLHDASRWIVSWAFGVAAASLAWPLAGALGLTGRTRAWFAVLVAFGTLVFPLSVRGNGYYLAHAEATAATFVALIEWQGRRRPWVVAVALGLAGLARPTVLLALIPLGGWLLWTARSRGRALLELAVPVGAVALVTGFWNLVRFGSPLETGYAIAVLTSPALIAAREQGVFSWRHVGPNLAILLGGGFEIRPSAPWLVPSLWGHSILLTTPALLIGIGVAWRGTTVRVMAVAALLISLALLTYYGGAGFETYGYRYFLDATPFLLVLVATAMRRRFGRLERLLVILSVAFCSYGVVAGFLHLA